MRTISSVESSQMRVWTAHTHSIRSSWIRRRTPIGSTAHSIRRVSPPGKSRSVGSISKTVSSNVVSVGYRLGTESNRWDDVYANSATADDIVIRPGGSVQSTQPSVVSMQLDLESTSSNIVASSASYTVGTPSIPWSNVYTTTAHVANSLIIVGNVTDPSGNSVGFDLENVDVALLPRYGDQWIGTNVRPWETIDASSLVVGDFGGNTITTAIDVNQRRHDRGTSRNHGRMSLRPISQDRSMGYGSVTFGPQLDIFTGTIEALDGVTLKSEPVSFRFLPTTRRRDSGSSMGRRPAASM